MNIEVRSLAPHECAAAWRFISTNGWAHRVGDEAAFAALIAGSQRTAAAWDEAGELLGFARGITDGLSNGYLSMVVVAPAARRQGLGRRLVQHVMENDPRLTWVLRAGRDGAAEFFAALGFAPSTVAMERPRRQP